MHIFKNKEHKSCYHYPTDFALTLICCSDAIDLVTYLKKKIDCSKDLKELDMWFKYVLFFPVSALQTPS